MVAGVRGVLVFVRGVSVEWIGQVFANVLGGTNRVAEIVGYVDALFLVVTSGFDNGGPIELARTDPE